MSENTNNYESSKAVQELARRGVRAPKCPYCGGMKFSISGELATISVTKQIGSVDIGTHIPSAVLICENCGNLQFFALAKLGMMERKETNEK